MLSAHYVTIWPSQAKTAPTNSDVVTFSNRPQPYYFINQVGTILPYAFPSDTRYRVFEDQHWVILEMKEDSLEVVRTETYPAVGFIELAEPATHICTEKQVTHDTLVKVVRRGR